MIKEKDISKMETTTLTERWKNGELDVLLDVYVKGLYEGVCIKMIYYLNQYLGTKLADEIEILAPVPTYEEWEELQESNDGLSKLMFKSLMNRFVKADEERERLEKENAELTTKCSQLEQENAELVQKIHILNEANMNLENTVGKFGEQLNEANSLLLGFLDENICSFDHNGYCQEHSSTEPDYRCIQQQLKWYFKKYEVLK